MTIVERARALRLIIEQAAQSLDDNVALTAVELYPNWESGKNYPLGYKVRYGGKLWSCVQSHISLPDWQPPNVPALFTEINETHSGSAEDPIPYDGNMALESGKHYSQNGVIYVCTRDTVNPVYHALADLVGLYVEVVA